MPSCIQINMNKRFRAVQSGPILPNDQDLFLPKRTTNRISHSDNNIIAILLISSKCFNSVQVCSVLTTFLDAVC